MRSWIPAGGYTMGKLSGIELKRARLVPSSVFTSPDQVVSSADLSRAQKIAILRRWEFDARETGPGVVVRDIMLDQVRRALAAVGAASPVARPAVVTRH
jgi:hypothetical protein